MQNRITKSVLEKGISWDEYWEQGKQFLAGGIRPVIYEDVHILEYTEANFVRMEKVLNDIQIDSKLYNLISTLSEKWMWILLTEQWCGDASQVVPIIKSLADCSANIDLKILRRDENLNLMDLYLTHGGRAIPKLICVKTNTLQELGTWGPRPFVLQKKVEVNKNNTTLTFQEKVKSIHEWYEMDKTKSTQEEFIDLIKNWKEL